MVLRRYSFMPFKGVEDLNEEILIKYSQFKHGSGHAALQFGTELAESFFQKFELEIVSNKIVVMESAYSFIRNASSIMTDHFISCLNFILFKKGLEPVERLKINRSLPYITDYGKLSKEKREELLKADTFSFDSSYVEGKMLLFLDDVYITGSHQRKIEEMLARYAIPTEKVVCLYYMELINSSVDASIESFLNMYSISTIKDLVSLILAEGNDYKIIVRTIKFLLFKTNITDFLQVVPLTIRKEIFNLAIGEKYHLKPEFKNNMLLLEESIGSNTYPLSISI